MNNNPNDRLHGQYTSCLSLYYLQWVCHYIVHASWDPALYLAVCEVPQCTCSDNWSLNKLREELFTIHSWSCNQVIWKWCDALAQLCPMLQELQQMSRYYFNWECHSILRCIFQLLIKCTGSETAVGMIWQMLHTRFIYFCQDSYLEYVEFHSHNPKREKSNWILSQFFRKCHCEPKSCHIWHRQGHLCVDL